MSLIICHECGKKFSEFASKCPDCGCPIEMIKSKISNNSKLEEELSKRSLNKNELRFIFKFKQHKAMLIFNTLTKKMILFDSLNGRQEFFFRDHINFNNDMPQDSTKIFYWKLMFITCNNDEFELCVLPKPFYDLDFLTLEVNRLIAYFNMITSSVQNN